MTIACRPDATATAGDWPAVAPQKNPAGKALSRDTQQRCCMVPALGSHVDSGWGALLTRHRERIAVFTEVHCQHQDEQSSPKDNRHFQAFLSQVIGAISAAAGLLLRGRGYGGGSGSSPSEVVLSELTRRVVPSIAPCSLAHSVEASDGCGQHSATGQVSTMPQGVWQWCSKAWTHCS